MQKAAGVVGFLSEFLNLMKLPIRFFLVLSIASSGLLYFGTHAGLGTIRGVTMTVAFLLNAGALLYALRQAPNYFASDKRDDK